MKEKCPDCKGLDYGVIDYNPEQKRELKKKLEKEKQRAKGTTKLKT